MKPPLVRGTSWRRSTGVQHIPCGPTSRIARSGDAPEGPGPQATGGKAFRSFKGPRREIFYARRLLCALLIRLRTMLHKMLRSIFPSEGAETPGQYGFLGVDTVFRFVPYQGLRTINDVISHFLAAVGGQTVKEDAIL